MQRSSAWRGDAPFRLPDCFDCVSCTAGRGMPLRPARSRSIPAPLPMRPRAGWAASGRGPAAALFHPSREQAFGNARRVGVHRRQGRFPDHGGFFPQSAISSRQAGLFPAIRAASSAMMAAVSRAGAGCGVPRTPEHSGGDAFPIGDGTFRGAPFCEWPGSFRRGWNAPCRERIRRPIG